MLSEETRRTAQQGGFSLLEILVVMAILSVALATAIGIARRPPDRVELRSHATILTSEAMTARLRAVNEGRRVDFTPTTKDTIRVLPCMESINGLTLYFYPDGSVSGGPLCLTLRESSIRLDADPLTGLLTVTEDLRHE